VPKGPPRGLQGRLAYSWGLFCRDASFLPVEGTPNSETVAQLYRHKVLRMLLKEGAIAEGVVRTLLAWPHTGFGTHVSRAIPVDEKTPGVVARYMVRPPVTPERMLGEANPAQIIYRSDAVHPRHQANFRVFAPLDFLAEVSAHLPDAHEKATIFYGWSSNRTHGYRKQQGLLGNAEVGAAIAEARAPLDIRRCWARRSAELATKPDPPGL